MTGGTAADFIFGGAGNDTIIGNGGADLLSGGDNNDAFNFASELNLLAAASIDGGLGTDTIQMTSATTLTDADFAHATSVETLRLTGASTVTLGANAASAGITSVSSGAGATNITNSNGVTLNVNAAALAQNTALTLSGTSAQVVTNLVGDISASALTGTLNVTAFDALDNGISIATGSGATTIAANGVNDTITVNATTLVNNMALTLSGSAAEVVTGLVGNIAASGLTGTLNVTTADNTVDNGISITTGSAATTINASGTGDTVTVVASALGAGTALTLSGNDAATVTLTAGNLVAGTEHRKHHGDCDHRGRQ